MAAAFNSSFVVDTIIYGVPIALLIIVIAAMWMWRSSKKRTKNTDLNNLNEAWIIDVGKRQIVDRKEFYIHRDTDLQKNITSTYALFPDEERMAGHFLVRIKEVFEQLLGHRPNMEEEERKGRIFDEELALSKIMGGWFTAYSLKTNTQIPIWELEKYHGPVTARLIDGKRIEQKSIWEGLSFIDIIRIMERNIERRMAVLKAVQSAAQQYSESSSYENVANAMRFNAFAIIFAAAVLAIVLMSIPGSIHQAVTQAISAGLSAVTQVASGATHIAAT